MNTAMKFITAFASKRDSESQITPDLGQAWVRSLHGQPLTVDIPLVNTNKSDIPMLRIIAKGTMIDPRLKGRATEIANQLTFTHTVRSIGNQQHFIRLVSREAITRPQVNLQVTADGPAGIVHRIYSIQPRIEKPKESSAPAPTAPRKAANAVASASIPQTTPPTPSSSPPQLKVVPPVPSQSHPAVPETPGTTSRIAGTLAQLDSDVVRLQRLVSTLQRIATRQNKTLNQQRHLVEHIHAQAQAVVSKTRVVQVKLDNQSKQLNSLQSSVGTLSHDFDVPEASSKTPLANKVPPLTSSPSVTSNSRYTWTLASNDPLHKQGL